MANEIKEGLGLKVVLVTASKGIFDVHADGTLIFSKYQTQRFPESGEILRLLKR